MNFWLKYYRRIKLFLFCIVYPIFKMLYCFDKLILKWANQPYIVPVQNLPFRSIACISDSTDSTATNLSTPFATRSITSFRMRANPWKRWRISRRGSVLHRWEESTECVFNILFMISLWVQCVWTLLQTLSFTETVVVYQTCLWTTQFSFGLAGSCQVQPYMFLMLSNSTQNNSWTKMAWRVPAKCNHTCSWCYFYSTGQQRT